METESLLMLIGLAFIYGLTHALDADHIMAVSGLYGSRPGSSSIRLCLSWALGHGLVLLLVGIAIYSIGLSLPPRFSEFAEYLVGILLLLIGLSIARDLISRRARMSFHLHDGLRAHAHWQYPRSGQNDADLYQHDHRAVLVGSVHGAAGAAPLLALFPLAQISSSWLLLGYIAIYVSGIVIAMLFFGGVLSFMINQLIAQSNRVLHIVRSLAATGSVIMGLFLLRSLVPGYAG